jgi:hypothetical protein
VTAVRSRPRAAAGLIVLPIYGFDLVYRILIDYLSRAQRPLEPGILSADLGLADLRGRSHLASLKYQHALIYVDKSFPSF